MDMEGLIPDGDSLATVSSVTATPNDGAIAIGVIGIDDTEVQFTISGGIRGVTYKIEVRATTASGYRLEGDGDLRVEG